MAAKNSGSVGPEEKAEVAKLEKRLAEMTASLNKQLEATKKAMAEIDKAKQEAEQQRLAASKAEADVEEARKEAAQQREATSKAEAEAEKIRQEALLQHESSRKALAEAEQALGKVAREAAAGGEEGRFLQGQDLEGEDCGFSGGLDARCPSRGCAGGHNAADFGDSV